MELGANAGGTDQLIIQSDGQQPVGSCNRFGEVSEDLSTLTIEIQGHLPAVGVVLKRLAACCHELLARQRCRLKHREQIGINLVQKLAELLLFRAGLHIQTQGLLG